MSPLRTFGAVLGRDVFVTGRELPSFLAQVVLQPFFILFIFGSLLPQMGLASPNYAQLLLPGIIAMNAFIIGLQNTALPLVLDFSFSREIEDRLLAPMPIGLVAVEKILFGALRGVIGATLMIPIGALVIGHVHWAASGIAVALLIIVLGAITGGTVGMMLGTLVPPRRINIMFAVILTPLMFTAATQFPWAGLGNNVLWFKIVSACNPLTYVAEGMRAAVLPGVPHIALWVCLLALATAIGLFGSIGIKGFMRRALD